MFPETEGPLTERLLYYFVTVFADPAKNPNFLCKEKLSHFIPGLVFEPEMKKEAFVTSLVGNLVTSSFEESRKPGH